MAKAVALPSPPAYLDPLTEIYACYFYAVPRFFPLYHANTRWLLAIIRSGDVDRMKRKMELQPSMFRATYYQLLDDPRQLECRDPHAHSLFHKQSVLYLTVVGMALYFRSKDVLKLLLEYKDPSGEQLYSMNEPQYATHVLDTNDGDFHAYPLSLLIVRGGFYAGAATVLENGWNPRDPICMPIRRCYERRAYYYHDWLDYALCLMHDKPLLPIAQLVFQMIRDTTLYKLYFMPITVLKPASEDNRITTGIMDVEDLPEEAQMIGTKSLMEVAEDYSLYLQIRERYHVVKDCLRHMVCEGVDPEITMTQALDNDGGYEDEEPGEDFVRKTTSIPPDFNTDFPDEGGISDANANNNAAASVRRSTRRSRVRVEKPQPKAGRGPYISEPTRVLLHALHMASRQGGKMPLNQLLDAVSVYLRRHVYIIITPKKKKKDSKDDFGMQHLKQRYDQQKRDARNAITLLLNLLQLQLDRLDKLNKMLRDTKQRKFKHLDVTSHAFSKRMLIIRTLQRIRGLLLEVLVHSGEFVRFIEASFPPYSYNRPDSDVDFPVSQGLEQHFRNIQLELMTDFSMSKAAPEFLDKSALSKAAHMKELFLNLCVGTAPKEESLQTYAKHNRNSNVRNSKNASNVTGNAAADYSGDAQLSSSNWASTEETTLYNLLSGEAAKHLRDMLDQTVRPGGRVTFVKVKQPRPKPRCPERPSEAEGQDEEKAEPVEAAEAAQAAAGTTGLETGTGTETGGELALRLSEQIVELGRCAQNGADVTPKLVAIYHLLLSDLSKIAIKQETPQLEESAAIAEIEAPDAMPEGREMPWEEQGQEQEEGEEPEKEESAAATDRGSLSGSRRKAKRATGSSDRKPWRCGARGGRKGHHQQYQKARVFDQAPGGTEFELGSN